MNGTDDGGRAAPSFGPRERIALAAVVAAFVLWSAAFIASTSFVGLDGRRHFCLFDDAMISMRYGWNLAHGHGLVWNPGGERVEGVTNLLTTATMALWSLTGDKDVSVLLAQIFGVGCMVAAALVAAGLWHEVSRGEAGQRLPFGHAAAALGTLAYYPLVYWALMGMETGLVAALLGAAVWTVLRLDGRARPSLLLIALVSLAWLARPDTAPALAVLLSYRVFRLRRSGVSVRAAAFEALGLALVVALVSVARWSYYGAWVPNTYVLKMVGFPLSYRLRAGLAFLAPFWPSVLLPVALSAAGARWAGSRGARLLAGLFGVSVLDQIYVGGDAWPLWRMTAPSFPLLWVTALVGVGLGLARLGRVRPAAAVWATRAVPVLLASLLLLANRGFWSQWFLRQTPYDVEANRVMANLGLVLADVTTPDATLGVMRAGAIVFFSDRMGIDFLGKNDRYVASRPPDLVGDPQDRLPSLPGHNKYDLEYSIARLQPTYVSHAAWGHQDLRSFVRAHYAVVTYHGVVLVLRDGDGRVRWDRVTR